MLEDHEKVTSNVIASFPCISVKLNRKHPKKLSLAMVVFLAVTSKASHVLEKVFNIKDDRTPSLLPL